MDKESIMKKYFPSVPIEIFNILESDTERHQIKNLKPENDDLTFALEFLKFFALRFLP